MNRNSTIAELSKKFEDTLIYCSKNGVSANFFNITGLSHRRDVLKGTDNSPG